MQLHDGGVRATIAPFHRRRRERGDDGVARGRGGARHRRRVAIMKSEQRPTHRGFAARSTVRASEPARALRDSRAAAGVGVEDAQEPLEGIPSSQSPRRRRARFREFRARRGSLRDERLRLALQRAEVPEPLQTPKATPLRGFERGGLGTVAGTDTVRVTLGSVASSVSASVSLAAPLKRGFVMGQRLRPLASLLVLQERVLRAPPRRRHRARSAGAAARTSRATASNASGSARPRWVAARKEASSSSSPPPPDRRFEAPPGS